MTAHDILQAAAGHMKDRAAAYDKPEGERSIGAAVKAFNAVTGDGLMNTGERGWLFMAILKMVRTQQGGYRADNYEDGSAYFALMGESACEERKRPIIPELYSSGWTPEAIKQAAFPTALYTEATEARMDVVGQNGNTAEHYPADEWIPSNGQRPELPDSTLVDVKFLDGDVEGGRSVGIFAWSQDGESDDITHYRIHQPE